jgi:hypothetical protein
MGKTGFGLGTVNFADVEQFEGLGLGSYVGHIEYIRYREPRQEGKFAQLSVCLVADEGEAKGEKTWQNLSFSPKALWRMAKFFGLFGIEGVDFDSGIDPEDPFDLLDPDLTGEPVEFTVSANPSPGYPNGTQTEVTAWLGGKPARKAKPAPADEDDDTVDADEAKPARRTFGSKPAAAGKRTLR